MSARRGLTWVLCLGAIVTGSLAWALAIHLNTWGDPTMTNRVVQAELADPAASDEVIWRARQQLIDAVPDGVPVTPADIDALLETALTDPNIRRQIAFAVTDGSTDPAAPSAVFRDQLERIRPDIADLIGTAGPRLSLPDLSPPTSLDEFARRWVWPLAGISATLWVTSFVFGDPRRTARRLGWWASLSAVLWVVGPYLAARYAPGLSDGFGDTTRVAVEEYTRPIRPWAIVLGMVGVVAMGASFVIPGLEAGREPRRSAAAAASRRGTARSSRRPPTDAAASAPARRPSTQPAPATSVISRAPIAPTAEMPTVRPATDDAAWARTGTVQAARTAADRDTDDEPSGAPSTSRNDDVDVWAAYESSADDAR